MLEPTLVHNLCIIIYVNMPIVRLPSQNPINPSFKASITARDLNQNTALHLAALNGNT